MATADEIRALKARVSAALLANDDVRLVDVARAPDGSYALRVGVASLDAPGRLSEEVKAALAGQPVTYVVVEPFQKQ